MAGSDADVVWFQNPFALQEVSPHTTDFWGENATVRGRAWYKLLDAPVLTLDVTVPGDRSRWGSVCAEFISFSRPEWLARILSGRVLMRNTRAQ